ncbi:hypothetical protein [Haloactinopolyspora sp.]|uniref:hypothetical protein n=1 Tax=Haloactinopolyspora sp. TaxID=1966353 RepID=UPI00260CF90D|nr:hypothetical protein [Haloactinopolyspora sp.]
MPTTLSDGATAEALRDAPLTTGARRRTDASLAGRLNHEWARLRADTAAEATVRRWAREHEALSGCRSLTDVETLVRSSDRERCNLILLTLVRLAHAGDDLAGRTVLQLMLGKAIRIAASRCGLDTQHSLEEAAISALWTAIATYPVERRPTKVAANLAMDTLRAVTGELAYHRSETILGPETFEAVEAHRDDSADVELLQLLVWAVERGTVSAADATLILDIYTPAPGEAGGAAAAERHGLSWPAARQRSSRAVRKIVRAVRDDSPLAQPA